MTEQSALTPRQQWMQVLARAGDALEQYEDQLKEIEFEYIRQPETGMVMARGITGGNGQVFNVGEVAVTRCVVRLADGTVGYSYVVGRRLQQASLAAVVDALLQGPEHQQWHNTIIASLQTAQQQRRAERDSEVVGSKVNFFTMIRGD